MGFGLGSVFKPIKKIAKGIGSIGGGIISGAADVADFTFDTTISVGEFYVDAYGEIVETVGKTVGDFVDSTVTTVKAAAQGDPMAIAAVGLMIYGGYSIYAAMSAGAAGAGAAAGTSSVSTGSTAVASGSTGTGAAAGSAAAAGGTSAGAGAGAGTAGAASAAGSAGGATAAGSTAGTVAATEVAKQATLEAVISEVATQSLINFGVSTALSAIIGTPDVDIPEQEFVRPDEVFDVYGRTATGTSERSASVTGVTAGGDFENVASIGRI